MGRSRSRHHVSTITFFSGKIRMIFSSIRFPISYQFLGKSAKKIGEIDNSSFVKLFNSRFLHFIITSNLKKSTNYCIVEKESSPWRKRVFEIRCHRNSGWRGSPLRDKLAETERKKSYRSIDGPTLNLVGGPSAWANHCSTFARPWPRNFGMIGRPKLSLFIGESYFTAQ